MRERINVIEDEVETKLRAMEVFVQVLEKQYLRDGQAGAQAASSHVGWIFLPQRWGAKTYNDTGLAIDTAGRHKTLTQHLGDTGEPRAALCLEDISRHVATPMGRHTHGTVQSSFQTCWWGDTTT